MRISGVHIWRTTTTSAEQTARVGRGVGAIVRAGDLIAIVGELGAGKTQFIRGLAEGMGVESEDVASPTFVMAHEYTAPPAPPGLPEPPVLVHVDAYRIKSLDELESAGLDIAESSELRTGAVIAIEWADRLPAWGEDVLEVELTHTEGDQRRVAIAPHGRWIARMGTLRQELDKMVGGNQT